MARNINKDLEDLFKILKAFPLEEFETKILLEFPDINLQEIEREMSKSLEEMTPASLALRIIKAIEEGEPSSCEIQDKIAVLKITKVATSKTQEWQVLEMMQKISEVSVENMVPRIGRSLKVAMRPFGQQPVVYSYKRDDFIFVSVSPVKIGLMRNNNKRKPNPINFAIWTSGPFIFVTPKTPEPYVLEGFVQGLGFETLRDSRLKGRDLYSLLTILDRKRNLPNPSAVVIPPTYEAYPVVTDRGIDFTDTQAKESYLDSVLGANAPLSNILEVEGRCPNPEEMGGHMDTMLRIKSDNVSATVREMVLNNVMRPDSIIVKLLQGNRNQCVLPD